MLKKTELETKKAETKRTEQKKTVTGLCSNCKYEGKCMSEKQGLVHCEEHAVSPVALTDADIRDIMYAEPEKKQEQRSGGRPAEGLCMNCDRKQNCEYIQPGNVIWHCEEYA